MKGITRAYLLYLINDYLKFTIHLRRKTPRNYFANEAVEITEDEIIDFIISIPYFGTELKDFMMGNLSVQMIIISQAWEREFSVKTMAWAADARWTETDMSSLSSAYRQMETGGTLNMPY